MSIRKRPDRSNRWEITWWSEGKRRRYLLPPAKKVYGYDQVTGSRKIQEVPWTESDARSYETALRSARQTPIATSNPRLNDIIPEFLNWAEINRKPKTLEDYKVAFKPLLQHFGNLHLNEITTQVIDNYKKWRLTTISSRLGRPVSPRSPNKELDYLSGILTWAKKRKYLSVKPEIEKIPYKKKLPVVPAKEVLDLLINNIEPQYQLMFDVFYYTGLRSRNLRNLNWSSIDFFKDTIQIEVNEAKGRQIIIPIHDEILQPLKELYFLQGRPISGLVFPSPRTKKAFVDVRHIIKRAKESAGITMKITPHLFRHAIATHLCEMGVPLEEIQFLLGHKEISTTQIYAKLSTTRLRDSMKKLGGSGGSKRVRKLLKTQAEKITPTDL